MSQIGFDKTSIQAVVLSRKCYLTLFLLGSESRVYHWGVESIIKVA